MDLKNQVIDPARLTASGERTLRRMTALASLAMPPEQFLTALGTAVEVHVSRIIGFLVDLSDVDATALGRALLKRAEEDITRTWSTRNDWLANAFGITVAGHPAWQQFDTIVEARNAVVHGDGFLSDQQLRRSLQAINALRQRFHGELEIDLVGGRLTFTPSSSPLAHCAARKYVAHLDGEVINLHPAVRRL